MFFAGGLWPQISPNF